MALTLDISIFPSPITLSSAVTLTTLPITPHPYSLFWYSMNLHSRQIGNSLMRVDLLFLLCWRSDRCGQIYRQLYCRTLRRNSLLPLCGLHRQCWRWMLPVPWCSVRSCVSRWGSQQRCPATAWCPMRRSWHCRWSPASTRWSFFTAWYVPWYQNSYECNHWLCRTGVRTFAPYPI